MIFSFFSWLMVALAGSVAIIAVFKDRSLLLKPTFLVSILFLLQLQIGSAILAPEVVSTLVNPIEFLIVIHVFPLVALLWSLVFFRKRYRKLFNAISGARFQSREVFRLAKFTAFPAALIGLWYLSVVPFSSTGLFGAISNPELADLMREQSFEALNNPVLKYSYYFMSFALAPVTGIFASLTFSTRALGPTPLHKKATAVVIILLMVFLVSLYGARGPSAMLIMSVLYAHYVLNGAPLNPIRLLLIVLGILLVPTVFVLVKNIGSFSIDALNTSFMNIADRAFVRGVRPNIWYFDYIQSHGLWGVSGVPKLAVIFGEKPVNVANHISLLYDDRALLAGNANSSYVTQYYSFFGALGLLVSMIGLHLLDCIILFFRRWEPIEVLTAVSALIIPFASLSFTQITTAFLSKGIVFVIVIITILRLFYASSPKLFSTNKLLSRK